MRLLAIILTIGVADVIGHHDVHAAGLRLNGAGAKSCANFVQQAGPDGLSDTASLQWVLGYLAGHAAATNQPHRSFGGPNDIAVTLLTYCRAHPIRQLDGAAASFFERTRRCRAVHGCGQP